MKDFYKAIFAGIAIAIASIVYLSIENKVIGATIFSIGLITVVAYNLNLYTGKVGYVLQKDLKYKLKILLMIIGNLIGTIISSLLIMNTRYASKVIEKATILTDIKLSDNLISIFILSIFCGFLMFIGVNGFKQIKHELGKYLIVILAVVAFILASFEHSIANTVYFTLSSSWSLNTILYFIVMLLGNAAGAIFLTTLNKEINE